jgi:CBS domain-containing protein
VRPKRGQTTEVTDFEDPLKNYDGPIYADALERSLAEDTVEVMCIRPVKTVSPTMLVEEAMRVMIDLDIACLLITENDRLVGIFSERNVLDEVAFEFEKVRHHPIREVMTPDPVAIHVTDTPGKALNLMATGGFRHVPILDMEDKVTGILGPRRVTAYLQRYFLRG